MSNATIEDVAKLAGVSIKTVSRVVNAEANVRDTTRQRVNEAVRQLRYIPNQSARKLASRRSFLIGLVYDDPARYEVPSSGYVIKLQQGLLRACKAANYELLLHPCNYEDPAVAQEICDLIERTRVDGLAIAPPLSNVPAVITAVKKMGTPYVQIAPGINPRNSLYVSTNDREVSREMTVYLASLGHKRIGFLKGHTNHKAVGHRFDGYMEGLAEAGLPFRVSLVCQGDNSIGSGEKCASALLGKKYRPTAIFAGNDDMAAGIIRVAQRMGLNVPRDLSVTGFDNIPLAQQIFPALTTVNQPLRQMADSGARLLIDSLQSSGKGDTSIMIKGEIIIRDSTGPAPG